jgi:Tol biopolymer transport system component
VRFGRFFALLASVPVLMIAPTHAAFPGKNGRVAFEYESPAGDHTQTDVYTVEPNSAGLQQLTATPNANEFGATWSADGGRIAFWRTKAPFGPARSG